MKLSSIVKISTVALAIATTPVFADDASNISVTINGKTYTVAAPGGATTNSTKKSECKKESQTIVVNCGEPVTISGSGSFTIPGKFLNEDFDEYVKELANDPNATVVKDKDGNITSVKLVKSNNCGKIVKDGKVVKSWGDEDADEDAQKMIKKMREELKSAGLEVPDFECCGTACGKALPSEPDASIKAKIEKVQKARSAERKANKAKIDEAKKAKAAERKAMQQEIDELRKELAELKKQLSTAESSK